MHVDVSGKWDYESLPRPLNSNISRPVTENVSANYTLSKEEEEEEDPIRRLSYSIVSIDCHPPFMIDGSRTGHSYGAGTIVSLDPPLIVCDRDTVPIGISVISVTFQNSLTVSAKLLFLHPFYNFAVLEFDLYAIIHAGIKVKAAVLDKRDFHIGDTVNYVGLSGRQRNIT